MPEFICIKKIIGDEVIYDEVRWRYEGEMKFIRHLFWMLSDDIYSYVIIV